MKRIAIERRWTASFVIAVIVLLAHFALSWPAMTCRGYPVIYPYLEAAGPYLGFLGVALFSLFDDRPWTRHRLYLAFIPLATFILAAAQANTSSSRPHYIDSVSVLNYFVADMFIVVPFVVCLDRLAAYLWNGCRVLTEPRGFQFGLGTLLVWIAVIGLLLAVFCAMPR